ncbi:MAG: DUF2341 domain-containing protein [Bacteroidetes bacterium]|nr:DUF2341 domain-containing protein [Bacteroidota bacterium]
MRLLLFVAFLFSSLAGFTAPSGYSFYKKLSVQESQITVNNNSLSGFPVLVRITDADLKSVANGGRVQSNNGYDIVYTASDMNTLIPFQMESYDAVTGTLVAWVKIPTISATVNTDFYLFFGNANNTINLGSKSTWDANYKGVYHLHADVADGTINASNLTNTGTTNYSPGLAADGQRIGSGNYLSRAATAGLQITGDFTLEAWMLPNSLISGSNENIVLSSSSTNNGAAATNINYCLSISGSGGSAGTLIFKWQYSNNSDEQVSSTAPITNTTVGWHNITVVRDVTAKQVRFYFDGLQLGAAVSFSNLPSGGASNSFLIGKNLQDPGRTIDAVFDEVRISNSIRTPEWIQAEYNNYKAASSFISYSPTASVSPLSFCFCSIDMSDFTSLGTFNSHTYYVSTQKENWQNADSIARSRGGHLVSITSLGENTFLTLTSLLNNVWTGLNDSITEGTFVWSSGEPFSYSNWALLQPDNSGNSDYALFGLLGSWDDQKNNPQLFVIEFDCTAPTPVTVNAGPDQLVCGNASNLSATPIPVSAFGSWSLLSGAGSIANPSVAATTVTGLDNGPNAFIWKVGNGSCSASLDTVVLYTDTVKPTLICPANIVVNNSLGLCSGFATWAVPTFSDNCPGASIVQTAGLASGSAFPVGNNAIKYIVTDGNGNSESCGFDVIVIDNELPKISCSGNLSFPSDPGTCGTIVNGITPLNFSDNCGGFNITHLITGSTNTSGINDASGTPF